MAERVDDLVEPLAERRPARAVPGGDVVGGDVPGAGEVSSDDQLAVVDVDGVHFGIAGVCGVADASAHGLPTRAGPACHAVGPPGCILQGEETDRVETGAGAVVPHRRVVDRAVAHHDRGQIPGPVAPALVSRLRGGVGRDQQKH